MSLQSQFDQMPEHQRLVYALQIAQTPLYELAQAEMVAASEQLGQLAPPTERSYEACLSFVAHYESIQRRKQQALDLIQLIERCRQLPHTGDLV